MKGVIIYNLWQFVQIMDAAASVLAAWYLLRLRQTFSNYIAAVFICISVEAIIAATSLYLFWQPDVKVSLTFAIVRIIGRGIKAMSLWLMVLYCLGYLNGTDKTDTRLR